MACSGIVKTWVDEKGFGFLLPDIGGGDVFAHRSALVNAAKLAVGDRVTFDKVDDGKARGRSKAVHVTLIGSAADNDCFGGVFGDLSVAEDGGSDGVSTGGLNFFLEVAGEQSSSISDLLEQFILESSLGCPFLVLSEEQLIDHVRAPSEDEFARLLDIVGKYVDGCEARCPAMIADFEGEMPGHGGVLSMAQLQWTSAVHAETLAPHIMPAGPPRTLGLLVNLDHERCIAVLRRIMESPSITKFMWGANGDCQSLLYQELPVALTVRPVNVVDAKNAFHNLGLARMLEHVPPRCLEGLPSKEQIDFDSIHAQNRRAFARPVGRCAAAYAVDDLHRIEAVLRYKVPAAGSYAPARGETENMMQELLADPYGMQAFQETVWRFQKRSGAGKACKAVELMRHIVSLRARKAQLTPKQQAAVESVKVSVTAELEWAGVAIPEDLSFSGDVQPECKA